MTVRLIQGFFWQQWALPEVGTDRMGDVAVVVKSGMCRFMFAGIIFPDPTNVLDDLTGEMHDDFGYSRLSEVIILPREVSFIKLYDGRPDGVNYKFLWDGSIWVGEFSGAKVSPGKARCIITKVPDGLFGPSRA